MSKTSDKEPSQPRLGDTALRIGIIIGTLWGIDPNACEELIKNQPGDFRYAKETEAVLTLYKTIMQK